MSILCFSDILKKVGLDPSTVKLIRHPMASYSFNQCYKCDIPARTERTAPATFRFVPLSYHCLYKVPVKKNFYTKFIRFLYNENSGLSATYKRI